MSHTGPCPRCNKEFSCNKEDIGHCGCSAVALKPATRQFLMHTFFGCVCNECLLEVETLVTEAGKHPFPGRGGELIPDLHYYTEKRLSRVHSFISRLARVLLPQRMPALPVRV